MKVMFYMPEAIVVPWHEMFLDLLEQHLRAGDECVVLGCSGNLPICYVNPEHKFGKCHLCKHRMAKGLEWLGRKVIFEQIDCLTAEQRQVIRQMTRRNFGTTEAVKGFELEGNDVGSSAISSVITMLREPVPEYGQHRELIHKYLETAITVHYTVKNLLEKHSPDKLVLFNGRIATQRPVLRLGVAMHIDTLVLEEDLDPNNYVLTMDAYCHNADKFSGYIKEVYDNSDLSDEEKFQIGFGFFDAQRHTQFSTGNDLTLEDINFDAAGHMVVTIFNSSEDEFVCIPELKNPFYKNQEDGLVRIVSDLLATGSIKVILRVHPNLRGVDNTQTRSIKKIRQMFDDRLTVFDAESKIDSYHLIEHSDLVVTFGSTVGLEAIYYGTTSILMGRSFYESLNCIIKPTSHDEFVHFVREFDPAKPVSEEERRVAMQDLARYGFFVLNFGYKAQFRRTYGNNRDGVVSLIKDGAETFLDTPWLHKMYPRIKQALGLRTGKK